MKTSHAAKTSYLQTSDDPGSAYVTLIENYAGQCAEPLGAFLDCIVTSKPVEAIAPWAYKDTGWHGLLLPTKHHALARVWIDGWLRGRRDGLDDFNRRPRSPTTREFLTAEAFIEGVQKLAARAAIAR